MRRGFTAICCVLVLLGAGAAFAQAPGLPPGPGMTTPTPLPPEQVRMVAVEGLDTGAPSLTVANNLRGLRSLLQRLGPDTFTEVAQREAEAAYGVETILPINSRYRLAVRPVQPTEAGGVRFTARVEQRGESGTLNAITTEGEAVHGQALVFRGLDGPNGGELVLIMSFIRPENDEQSQSESSESEESDGDDEPESDASTPEEDEGESPDPEEPETPEDEEEEPSDADELEPLDGDDEQEPREFDNLEAILESLEEMDNREQAEMRNRRTGVPIRGDWW